MRWVIQDNMYNEEGFHKLLEALDRVGSPYDICKVVPFVAELHPDVNPTGDVVVMGAYTMTKIAKKKGWYPGAILDNLDYEVQANHWGKDYMLNGSAEIYAFKDVPKQDSLFFIRPVSDGKAFTGYVTEWFAFDLWRRSVMSLSDEDSRQMSGDTMVMVSNPGSIYSETRTWVVKGEVVTASLYKRGGKAFASADVEPRIVEFAQARAREWSPNEAYCLDIADTPDGLKIVEVNCLNASGFYQADMLKLVVAIEEGFGPKGCSCMYSRECRWCLEMANRHPSFCEVCKDFASNSGSTPLECVGDCYIHSTLDY